VQISAQKPFNFEIVVYLDLASKLQDQKNNITK
jgi:hypothetical protein